MTDPYVERAQAAEAKVATAQEGSERLKEKIRDVFGFFGISEKYGGAYSIDYEKLVDALGMEQSIVLRGVIDQKYRVSGAPGEKPRVRV